MSFPAYPSYQDSGVEWLGSVPSHWEIAPLKRLLEIRNGADHKHVEQDEGYPVIGSGGPFTFASEYLFDGESILLGRKGTVDKPLYVTGRFWTVDTMYWSKIRPESHGRFAYYTATTIPFGYYSTNTALPSMTQSALNGHFVARPPMREQVAIAAFLDRETAKIDALIDEQRRLIALLKEKRQAVISHAVTKGIDPLASMQDSRVEWMGQVPAHWSMKRLSGISAMIQSGPFGSQLHAEDYIKDGNPVINPANIRDGKIVADLRCSVADDIWLRLAHHQFQKGDIVFGRRGEMGRCALVSESEAGWLCGTGCLTVRLREGALPGYYVQYLSSQYVREMLKLTSVGSTMDNLNASILGNLMIPVPPLNEQHAIVDFLAHECGKLGDLLAEVERATILLHERRASLISAVITGKIDVRQSAKILPFPIDRTRARRFVATEIIERLAHQPTFGRTKLQKIAYLAEAHANITELAGCYIRMPFGPLARLIHRRHGMGLADVA